MRGFRCPHCQQRTLGAWQKFKSNGWNPGRCAHCGGRYVPMVWTALLPVPFFLLALLAAQRMIGPLSSGTAVALIVAAAVSSFAAATAIYLFTPLLRHDSPAARWDLWSFVVTVAAVIVYAAVRPPPAEEGPAGPTVVHGPTAVHVSDPKRAAEYKYMLRNRDIPFRIETREGKEFIILGEQPQQKK